MKKKIVIPFTNETKTSSKKTFKLLNNNEIDSKIVKNNNLMKFVKKILFNENNKNADVNSNESTINYVKASKTKNYYKNIKE